MCGTSSTTENKNQFQMGTSSTTLPQWATAAGQNVYDMSSAYAASNPYARYSGPTEAGFGPQWNTSTNYATSALGTDNPYFKQAGGALSEVLGDTSKTAGSSITDLMSPYTQGVLQPTLRAIATNAADRNNGTAAGTTMSGAFGDSGWGVQRARNDRDTQNAISDATAGAYDKAYTAANATKSDALSKILSAASGLTTAGTATASQKQALAQLLATMGAGEQGAGQTGINTGIKVNADNNIGQLGQYAALQAILRGAPMDTTTATQGYSMGQGTTTKPDNSLLGLGGSALGSLFGEGSSDSIGGKALSAAGSALLSA